MSREWEIDQEIKALIRQRLSGAWSEKHQSRFDLLSRERVQRMAQRWRDA